MGKRCLSSASAVCAVCPCLPSWHFVVAHWWIKHLRWTGGTTGQGCWNRPWVLHHERCWDLRAVLYCALVWYWQIDKDSRWEAENVNHPRLANTPRCWIAGDRTLISSCSIFQHRLPMKLNRCPVSSVEFSVNYPRVPFLVLVNMYLYTGAPFKRGPFWEDRLWFGWGLWLTSWGQRCCRLGTAERLGFFFEIRNRWGATLKFMERWSFMFVKYILCN